MDGGSGPRWSADGSELFYRQGNRLMVVPIEVGKSLELGRPVVLFEGEYLGRPTSGWDYDVNADGQHFLMLQAEEDRGRRQINVVTNWFEELNRLIPTD